MKAAFVIIASSYALYPHTRAHQVSTERDNSYIGSGTDIWSKAWY
ncbi:MAG: hypothetical protein NVS9B15_24420 [Acidobacteriaceae bacterium]